MELLQILLDAKPKAGDGNNFPPEVWTTCSTILNPKVTKGGPKTAKVCSNKYGQVRASVMIAGMKLSFQQLRGTYKIVEKVRNNSGWAWDDQKGASIGPTTASSWDDYIKAHPKAKPFRNRGWPYWALMAEIMPRTVSGAHVFRAGGAHAPVEISDDESGSENGAPDPDTPSATQDEATESQRLRRSPSWDLTALNDDSSSQGAVVNDSVSGNTSQVFFIPLCL